MITKEHREYLRRIMGLTSKICPICKKRPEVTRLTKGKWYCYKCANKQDGI
jgi:ribosomal protein L37AE/L43A